MTQAMGNWDTLSMYSEAASKNALGVGGIYHQNDLDFSNDRWHAEDCRANDGCASIGPTADGRVKPDLVGPTR